MKHLKIILIPSLFFLLTPPCKAGDLTPEEGLQKIQNNIELSLKNRESYEKANEQVRTNIQTLENSKVSLQEQRKKLSQQMTENKTTLILHQQKLKDIEKLKQTETRQKGEELAKIDQLEKTLAQLKDLQLQRQNRLQQLDQDSTSLAQSQQTGEKLQQTLSNEIKELDSRLATLTKEVTPWIQKKKSYEKEALRWSKEQERHEKMKEEVKVVMDSAL